MTLVYHTADTIRSSDTTTNLILHHHRHIHEAIFNFRIAVFLALCIFPISAIALSSSCINYDEVRSKNVTAYTFIITWKFRENCIGENRRGVEQIEIKATLKKYCACESCDIPRSSYSRIGPSNEPGEKPIIKKVRKETFIVFGTKTRLHPYSEYEIEVVSLSTDFRKKFNVRTRSGNPYNVPIADPEQKSLATTQSVQFYWKSASDDECKLQNGIPDGYRVELWGLDTWATSKRHRDDMDKHLETKNTDSAFYYAQNLEPYTNYLLKVFSRNIKEDSQGAIETQDLYNHTQYLRIHIQTLPTIPKPPTELEAIAQSYTSIHLRWVPNYPPTGRIARFILKEGELAATGSLTWKNFKQFDPAKQPSLCASTTNDMNTSFHDPYCCVISDLLAETTYFFSVQVFNVNVTDGSEFSKTFNVTTDSSPLILPTSPSVLPFNFSTTKLPNSGINLAPKSSVQKPETSRSSGTIVIIVLSIGVLLLLIICFVLRQKIRKTTEKIILRAGVSSTHQTTLNCLNTTDESLVNFNSSVPSNIGYGNEITRNTSIASSYSVRPVSPSFESHVIRSVVNQIEEIQSRKLPDAPHVSLSGNLAVNNLDRGEVLWGLELQKMEEKNGAQTRQLPLPPVRRNNYCDPEDSVRVHQDLPTSFDVGCNQQQPDIIQQHRQSSIVEHNKGNTTSAITKIDTKQIPTNGEGDEECTDTYGYLRPTFLRPSSIQGPPDSPNDEKPPILPESYTQVTSLSPEFISQSGTTGMGLNINQAIHIRPNSNESELSFSNLRTYNNDPKNQSTHVEFEGDPLISQMPMNV